jgi:nitrogen fixation NifU-like protein
MQNILDHFHDPENYGDLEGANKHIVEHNPLCGDKIELFLIINGGVVVDVKFKGEGCAISQAAMSMLSSEIIGKAVSEVEKLRPEDIVEMIGIELSPTRLKCALLSLQAVSNAIK